MFCSHNRKYNLKTTERLDVYRKGGTVHNGWAAGKGAVHRDGERLGRMG